MTARLARETWTVEHGMTVRRHGDGPHLIWIHGLGEWSANFDPVARHAVLRGFTHVLPDLPGCGRSAPPAELPASDAAIERAADHLARWLADQPPAILVGHSLGGVLATIVAERVPRIRAVVNVDGNLTRGDCTTSAEAAAWSFDDFVDHGFEDLLDAIYRRGLEDPALRRYHVALSTSWPALFHRQAVDLVRLASTATLAARFARLAMPTFFLAGVPGGICEQSRQQLDREGIRWVGIEPAGHWIHHDQPDDVVSAIASFAAEL